MKTLLIILFSSITFSCSLGRAPYKLYSGGPSIWNYSIKLNSDSTFTNLFKSHLKYDTASGNYTISADTIYFRYRFDDDDSAGAKVLRSYSPISWYEALLFTKSNFRDSIAVIKNKELLYKGYKLKQKRL